MNNNIVKQFIEQLNSIIEYYNKLQLSAKYDDLSDLGQKEALKLITRSTAAVERASGQDSIYSKQVREVMLRNTHDFDKLAMIIGVIESLKFDLEAGYLANFSELIHGEIFGDFLEMAEHLSDEGYKDAAAVIAGSALEAHLRQLCIKNGISVEMSTAKGIQPKKADAMNSELGSANLISKLDQKSVTAWLDLRNKAAHGRYTEYVKEQVALLITGIRDFITRNPA